jgi:hypothetical protein
MSLYFLCPSILLLLTHSIFFSAFGFQRMELNQTLAKYFTNYFNHVRVHYFDNKSPPLPTIAQPQPLFVKKEGQELANIGKVYTKITQRYLNKSLTVTIVRKVCLLVSCYLLHKYLR